MKTQYYRIAKKYRTYKGMRFFKFTFHSDRCFQVCVNEGEVKKGRGNGMGITLIHSMTFLGNYMAPGYAEPCRKDEYDRNFTRTVKLLK